MRLAASAALAALAANRDDPRDKEVAATTARRSPAGDAGGDFAPSPCGARCFTSRPTGTCWASPSGVWSIAREAFSFIAAIALATPLVLVRTAIV